MNLRGRAIGALLSLLLASSSAYANDLGNATWSETDSSNNAASPNGWTSGTMLPSQVEPTARAMAGAIKRWYDHAGPTVTSGGTANAQTLTYSVPPTAYAAGDCYTFLPGAINTGAATLNVNALGAKAVQEGGAALTGGEFAASHPTTACYDGTQFQLASPFGGVAYPGLATKLDMLRLSVGGFPFTDEFFGGTPFVATQGFVVAISTPSGTTGNCGGALVPCQDPAAAFYSQTNNTGRVAEGVYAEGGVMGAGMGAWGANFATINCRNHNAACISGAGFNVAENITQENDTVIVDTPTGAATGNFVSYTAILNAPQSEPVSGVIAYDINVALLGQTAKYTVGHNCESGATITCVNIGANSIANSSPSSLLTFTSIDSSGNALVDQFQQGATGDLAFSNTVNGASFTWAHGYPEWVASVARAGQPVTFQVINAATGAGTSAGYSLETSTANEFFNMNLNDGTTPAAVLTTGSAVTGGINLNPGAGGVAVNSNLSVLNTFDLEAEAAPSGPGAGHFFIYMDSADNRLKAKGPSGTLTVLALP